MIREEHVCACDESLIEGAVQATYMLRKAECPECLVLAYREFSVLALRLDQ